MARTLKDHDARRGEILDAAIQLVYTKGYEQMAIQDILDLLKISKGAFYHYFDSKVDLLEGLIQRMSAEGIKVIAPIVADPSLPTLEKLERMFSVSARWKTDRKEFFLALLRVWYADDNAIVRQKMYTSGLHLLAPFLTQIIQQGVHEGILTTPYPDQIAPLIINLLEYLSEHMSILILDPPDEPMAEVTNSLAVFTDSLERLLGAPSHSLHLMDPEMIQEWFTIERQT